MDETTVDLYSAAQMRSWRVERMAQGWTGQAFFDHFTGMNTDIGDFRSLDYSNVLGPGRYDYEEETAKKLALTSNHPLIRLYAESLVAWHAGFRLGMTENQPIKAQDLYGSMQVYLEQVQNYPEGSEFRTEIEFLMLRNMLLRDSLEAPAEGIRLSQLLLNKAQLLNDFYVAWAYTFYMTALYFNSNFADVLRMRADQEGTLRAHFLFNHRQGVFLTVFSHFNALNPYAALTLVESVRGGNLTEETLGYWEAYTKLVYGLGAEDYDFNLVKEAESVPTNITNALQLVLKSQALIPGKMTLAKRRQLWFEALTVVKQRETVLPVSDLIHEHWTKAYLYHKIGSYSLSAHHLKSIDPPNPQELMVRTLVAGQKLELASVPGGFEVEPVETTLQELLSIYDLAATISPTNAEWFLKLLHRWYPAAAATLHYVRPIVEFEPYKQAIISFNNQNMAYGIPLPTNFCLEMFLREVYQDEELISSAPLNGSMIKTRDRLFSQHGDLTYFRVPVTAFKIAYLLLKSGLPNRITLVEVLDAEFGFPRNLRTTFESAMVENALQLISDLLKGTIGIQAFDRQVLQEN